MPRDVDALLFDLGGVVLNNDLNRVYERWAQHAGGDAALIRDRMRFNEHHDRYERGEISGAVWFAHLRELLGIDITDAQFLDGWNNIFIGEMPGIADILTRAKKNFALYAFSNTNADHEIAFTKRFAGVIAHFQFIFRSSRIGMRKPDRAAFAHVVKEMGVPASRIIFFDDLLENVEGARASGLKAVHVKSVDDIAAAIPA